MSERLCDEVSAKLHLPPGKPHINLSDLVDYNFNTTLSGTDAVFCGNCKTKTSQQQLQTLNSDVCLMEVVRAKEVKGYWSKNFAKITFPLTGIKLPGGSRVYRVVSTCHHRGSVNSGHWTTKELTLNGGWYELDDIKGNSLLTGPPGVMDDTVTLLLLIAEDKFRN
jgi:ubiquitin C-terminal hydrolase